MVVPAPRLGEGLAVELVDLLESLQAVRDEAGADDVEAGAAGAAELTAPKIGESRTSGLCGEVGSGLLGRGWTTP